MDENTHADYFDTEILVHGPEEKAKRAFDRLFARRRPALLGFLRAHGVTDYDRAEDILEEALLKLLRNLPEFEFRGVEAWWSYVYWTLRSCMIDRARRDDRQSLITDRATLWYDPGQVDGAPVVLDALEARWIWFMADCLWLGRDCRVSDEEHERRMSAARHYYIGRASLETVVDMMGPDIHKNPSRRLDTLEAWLTDGAVLRHLFFCQLYHDNARLARMLLALKPDARGSLDELLELAIANTEAEEQAGDEGETGAHGTEWTWLEMKAILLRYHRALTMDQMIHMETGLTPDELRKKYCAIFDKAASRLPFKSQATSLLYRRSENNRCYAAAMLTKAPLWKRLALEYRIQDDLCHEYILERMTPAAEVVGYDIKPTALHGWLYMGRIYTELRNFCVKADAGYSHG